MFSITGQFSGMLVRKNINEQIARLRGSDLLISPKLRFAASRVSLNHPKQVSCQPK
jgi:hypothetical protein